MMNERRVREEWEKRDDARTLARAEEIKADKQRLADAQKAARDIANEEIERVKGIMKIAGKSLPKKPATVEEPSKTHNRGVTPTATVQCSRRGYPNPAVIDKL